MDCISGILEEFKGLSRVPHGSWNEEAESAYLTERLRAMGLSPVTDSVHNVMADVPATPGHENAPRVILQGHMDMVCAVKPGSAFDHRRDSVTIVVEDGILKTDGRSSLGADNNLGNAVVLWLLNQNLPHGPLRLLFTVAEEVGLRGAGALDPAWLQGAKYLLNTDGFHLGRMVVSSAGGRRETFRRTLDTTPTVGRYAYEISFSGYPGGHSGDDIDKNRPNPIKLLVEFLTELGTETDYELAELSGGTGHNVIPTWARAVIVLPGKKEWCDFDAPIRLSERVYEQISRIAPDAEWRAWELSEIPMRVWTASGKESTLSLLDGLYNGVYAWHRDFPGIVSASANLGKVEVAGGQIEVSAFIRCTDPADEKTLTDRHLSLAGAAGFTSEANGYPSWLGDSKNELALLMSGLYRARTGKEMEVTAVHVGLEPSFFQEKAPDLIMVSTGPDIIDAHSVDERAPLESLVPYTRLLADTLEELAGV